MYTKILIALAALNMASVAHAGGYGSSQQIGDTTFHSGTYGTAPVSGLETLPIIQAPTERARASELAVQPSTQAPLAQAPANRSVIQLFIQVHSVQGQASALGTLRSIPAHSVQAQASRSRTRLSTTGTTSRPNEEHKNPRPSKRFRGFFDKAPKVLSLAYRVTKSLFSK